MELEMWGFGLINGLAIAMRNMLRGTITIRYPHERAVLPERARWALAPTLFEDGSPRCTACMTCVRTCPDSILSIDVTVAEDKTKHIDRFGYVIGACMMCGLCVEACPYSAIHMSHDYELAVTDPSGLMRELLHDVDAASIARHRAEKQPAAASAPDAEEGGARE
ncbi:MAG: 4Fe-4S dicluster domain-containing protein [Coriobacteriales bacterium]